MEDIAQHSADGESYLSEYVGRREAGEPSALDRANAALGRASQAAAIHSETTDECDRALIETTEERVALAARAAGIATRQGSEDLAMEFARVAEGEALVLDSFDYAKLDGLRRPEALSA